MSDEAYLFMWQCISAVGFLGTASMFAIYLHAEIANRHLRRSQASLQAETFMQGQEIVRLRYALAKSDEEKT